MLSKSNSAIILDYKQERQRTCTSSGRTIKPLLTSLPIIIKRKERKERRNEVTMIAVMVDAVVLKHTAIVTGILFFKFQFTNIMLGGTRIKSGARPPEDAQLFGSKAGPQDFDGTSKLVAYEKKDPDDDQKASSSSSLEKVRNAKMEEKRTARLVMNDLENIPLGLLVAWMDVLCGGNTTVHLVGVWLFCVGRCAHSYAYHHALQPARAIGFGVGLLATAAMAINAIIAL